MLLRHFIGRVVRTGRAIRPSERVVIAAMWRAGFTPRQAAGWLRHRDKLKSASRGTIQ